jgi:TRAP-type C4-dicarboxylate transport system substrate-binding protein
MRPILILAALALLAASNAEAAETIKFSTTLPKFGPAGNAGMIPWMRAVERDSGGDIKFEEFWGGQLIGNPTKEYDALVNGVCDMTIIVTSFVQQQFPDSHLFESPGVVRSAGEAAYGGWKMSERKMLRGMDKIHPAAIFANDPGTAHLAKPIKSLDQMKGLKIRVSGPAEAKIVEILGAAPVGMNITDAAESLSRGLYDGTFNGWAAIPSFRMAPLLKAHIDMPMGVRQFIVAINRAVYERLTPRARAAIDKNSGLTFSLVLARAFEADGIAERDAARKKGQIVPLTPQERARLEAAFRQMLDAWIAQTPDGKAKYDFLEAALEEYRAHPPALPPAPAPAAARHE